MAKKTMRELLFGGVESEKESDQVAAELHDEESFEDTSSEAADDLIDRRATEIEVYAEQYKNPAYRMGAARHRDVNKVLGRLAATSGGGSLLDVSTGRGETLMLARTHGFSPVLGTEVVQALLNDAVLHAELHDLPFDDQSFDHVTCFDALEHLLPGDVEKAIDELWRVCRRTLTVSASTCPSKFGGGVDLHPSARPAEDWEALLAKVCKRPVPARGQVGGTPCWRLVK